MHLLLKTLGIYFVQTWGSVIAEGSNFCLEMKVSHVQGTADERLSSGKTLTPCTALFYFLGSSAGNS